MVENNSIHIKEPNGAFADEAGQTASQAQAMRSVDVGQGNNRPKLRFKGFEGEWESSDFHDFFDLIKNNSLSRAELSCEGLIGNIHYGDVLVKYGECLDTASEGITYIADNERGKNLYKEGALRSGDIIFADAAEDSTVGKCTELICAENECIVSGLHTIACRPRIDTAQGYLGYYLNSNAYHNQLLSRIQGTKISSISRKAINATHIVCPLDKQEQRDIAAFFTSIDSLISACDARIGALKQVKEASLQAMFPQEGETAPKVRFKGFTTPWKTVKLGECLEISIERNFNNEYGINEVLSVSDEGGVMNQIELLGRSYAGKTVANYKILRTNQIVYTKSPLKTKPYGIVKINNGVTGIVSVLYAVYSTKKDICPEYIHYYFDPKFRINRYLFPLINKGAKNTMNIRDDVFLHGDILIPQTIAEQKQIAAYFAALDRKISLQAQRLEKLKQIKAACLDEMFV